MKRSGGRARSLANLKRGGSPGRKPGVPNAATREIKSLAEAMTVGDQVWLESARRRMIAGEAPHLETFFLSHRYGRPKDQDTPPDKPPILFISAYGPPGSYDPLARPAKPRGKPEMVAHGPSLSLPTGVPLNLPHGTTGPNGHARADTDPGDDGEDELVVVRG